MDFLLFEKPKNQDAKVWRYSNLAKLLDVLDKKSLYFARPDTFGDPYEGTVPKANREQAREVYRPQFKTDEDFNTHFQKMRQAFEQGVGILKQQMVVSCWHLNEYESAAMWEIYSADNHGVAIQSTFKKLSECFKIPSDYVHVGLVKYLDYSTEWMDEGFIWFPFMHKRKSFAHEQEVRAISHREGQIVDHGLYISVDPNLLIEQIYVHPLAPKWYTDIIRSAVKRFGFDERKVIKSDLYTLT
jgi:hypothetical protein